MDEILHSGYNCRHSSRSCSTFSDYERTRIRVRNTEKIGKNYKRDVEIIHRFHEKVFKRKKENYMKKMQQQHSLDKKTHNEEEPKIKTKQRVIDSLLDLHVKQGLMSEEDVIRDMEGFIFAGYDTTSNVMSWTLYFLGRFHEIQEKVYLEFQEIFKNDMKRDITIDDLTKMTYLECVIKVTFYFL
ncbi:cytochrome P450 4C1-like isoform X2 [Centruroides sculpturatus]|uniref:cytochrome P450 4C1-like isoform X2 n=1 Tax=Centruroides sculpturatus TaxID=218467 RepID=UPI000C6D74E3|nr:cytochrome P450 4C1-like isoform X2 [Centruroides sculpturatus]